MKISHVISTVCTWICVLYLHLTAVGQCTLPDVIPPDITQPANIPATLNIECGANLFPYALDTSSATVNRGLPSLITDNCLTQTVTRADLQANATVQNNWAPNDTVVINGFSIHYYDLAPTAPVCQYRIRRIWQAADESGNIERDTQFISIVDITPPTLATNAGILLYLGADCMATITADTLVDKAITSDNCGIADARDPSNFNVDTASFARVLDSGLDSAKLVTITDIDLSQGCPAMVQLEVFITDECGNVAVDTVTVMVVDTVLPKITAPASLLLSGCSEIALSMECPDAPYSDTLHTIELVDFESKNGVVSDNCTFDITYIDTKTNSPTNPIVTITRLYTVTDKCGNSATSIQVIEIEDEEGPMIVGPVTISPNFNISCDADLDPYSLQLATGDRGLPSMITDCVDTVDVADFLAAGTSLAEEQVLVINNFTISYTQDTVLHPLGVCDPLGRKYLIRRFWTAVDAAGNETTIQHNITIVDNSAPTLVTNQNYELFLQAGCELTINADTLVDGVQTTDNCDAFDALFMPLYDIPGSAMVRLVGSGQDSMASLTITVADLNFSLGCPIPLDLEVFVSDSCGNIAVDTVTVMVLDTVAPVITLNTAAYEFNGCDEDDIVVNHLYAPYSEVEATISNVDFENNYGLVDENCSYYVTYIDAADPGYSSCNGIDTVLLVNRTFTVTDSCGNSSMATVTIALYDRDAPTYNCPTAQNVNTSDNGTGDCATNVFGLALTNLADNCTEVVDIQTGYEISGATVASGLGADISTLLFNLGESTVKIHVEDCSGNTDTCSFTVTVSDDEVPSLTCPQDLTVETDAGLCSAVVNYDIIPADNCSEPMAVAVNLDLGLASGEVFPLGATMVRYIAIDEAGNSSVPCSFTVTVEDNEVPEITCPTVLPIQLNAGQCDSTVTFADPTATDNCGMSAPIITQIDTTGLVSGSTFMIGVTTLTYQATDDSGNTTTCNVSIEVVEFSPASMACIDLNVSLDAMCSGSITIDMVLNGNVVGCLDSCEISIRDLDGRVIPNAFDNSHVGKRFEYTFTCGGVSCWAYVNIEDYIKPTFTNCPNDTISCLENIGIVPDPTPSDNCSATAIKLEQVFTKVECDTFFTGYWTRKYIARDKANNVSLDTCVQTVQVQRTTIGTVTNPPSYTGGDALQCNSFPKLANGAPTPAFAGVPKMGLLDLFPFPDDSFCGGFSKFEDLVDVFGPCKTRVTRTWTIGEWWCNQAPRRTIVQVIEIVDREAPFVTAPADMTVSANSRECDALVEIPSAVVGDNCTNVTKVSVNTGFGAFNTNGGTVVLPVGTTTVYFDVEDACGNTNTDSMKVTVRDELPPIALCETHTVVSIKNDGIGYLTAQSLDDGSFDNCGPVTLQIMRVNDICGITGAGWTDRVAFCCEDVGTRPMVGLLVRDAGGRESSCMVEAVIQDFNIPDMTCPPASLVRDCDYTFDINDPAFYFGAATITGTPCVDNVNLVDEIVIDSLDQCRIGFLERKIELMFNSRLIKTCSQTITFQQAQPLDPSTIIWPEDFVVTDGMCPDFATDPVNLPEANREPIVPDGVCNQVGFTFVDREYPAAGNNACFKIIRTWSVIDWCGRNNNTSNVDTVPVYSHEQLITVNNTIAPTILSPDTTVSICVYTVDCTPVAITLLADANDDCTPQNELQWTYTITFEDGAKENGMGRDASGTYDIGYHHVDFTVRDKCGNVSQTGYDFEIKNCKGPTASCLNGLSTALVAMDTTGDGNPDIEMATVNPAMFNLKSEHICGYDLRFSFSADLNDTVKVFSCPQIGSQRIELWVTDENGNTGFCSTFIDVIDSNDVDICPTRIGQVSGRIANAQDKIIKDVVVDLVYDEIEQDRTDASGQYVFEDLPMGDDYLVKPMKDGDDMNGVSTLDLVMIQRHILGLAKLDNPYAYIAADINHDNKITSGDLVSLRRLILGVDSEFTHNTSWRFVDRLQLFPIPSNPWAEPLQETYQIDNLQSQMLIDFVGVKIGDINNNAVTGLRIENVENRNILHTSISIIDQKVVKGQEVSFQVMMNDGVDIEGLQLEIVSNGLRIIGFDANDIYLTADNVAFADEKLRLSTILTNREAIPGQNRIITVYGVALKSGLLSEMVSLSSDFASEAYSSDLEEMTLELDWRSEEVGVSSFDLLQNNPNPWTNETTFDIAVPQEGQVYITLTDARGRVILDKSGYYTAGNHTIRLTSQEVATSGVFICEVTLGTVTKTIKMIHLK